MSRTKSIDQRAFGASGGRRPPAADLARQQRAFAAFRREYNDERPHAALGGDPPLDDPGHVLVKRVTNAGTTRFKHRLLFLANALEQHHIDLEESGDGIWSIYLGSVLLARLDERDYVIRG